jgi:hypothetical protein
MPLTRHLLVPLIAAVIALLALVVPGALGAQGSPGVGSPPFATSSTGPTGPTTTLVATLMSCHADASPANRYAIFAAQMTSVTGTFTMAVNFRLQERAANSVAFEAVSAPGFGEWVGSQPGVAIYTYDHEVTALPAPAAFRVLVRARWFDRHHRVIRRGARVSPVCVQPLTAPALAIGRLTAAPGTQTGTLDYSVVVRNDGTVASGPLQVSLSVGAVALANVTVAGLAAGAKQVVQFIGPACAAGSTLTASVGLAGALSGTAAAAVDGPANAMVTKTFPCTA